MEEAGLACSDISMYGHATFKLPQSFVTSVAALQNASTGKTRRYNFQGSLKSTGVGRSWRKDYRRSWILPFVQHYFSASDYFKRTDAGADYVPMGSYDHTLEPGTQAMWGGAGTCLDLDVDYYQRMAESQFTLCPGGDAAWSLRFYEAILARSIPVIDSEINAMCHRSPAFWYDQIGYTYFTLGQ